MYFILDKAQQTSLPKGHLALSATSFKVDVEDGAMPDEFLSFSHKDVSTHLKVNLCSLLGKH